MVAVAVVAVVRAMRRPRTTREHLLRACSTGGPIGCHLLATFCLTFRAGSQRFAEVLKGWPKVRRGLQRIPQGCWLHAGSLPGPSMYVRGHDGMRGATPTVALMAAAMHMAVALAAAVAAGTAAAAAPEAAMVAVAVVAVV